MNKTEFLATLDVERAQWDAALGKINQNQMLTPGAAGEWTIKDLVAHVAWSEREMVAMIERRSLDGGSPLWDYPPDERNAKIYEENRARPLALVLNEAQNTYRRLRAQLNTLTDEDFVDPARLEMPPTWVPWEVLAGNTFEHYQHHRPELERWAETHSN